MYIVKVVKPFKDTKHDLVRRDVGDIYEIEEDKRFLELIGRNPRQEKFVELVRATKKKSDKREGKKIMIHQGYLYFIGGIETFLFNLTKSFRDKNITIVCNMIEPDQLVQLSNYADIEIDQGKLLECDVMILGNYDGGKILHRVKANKVYQMIHGDLEAMSKSLPGWENFKWNKAPGVDEVICVSETAAKGLENLTGTKSRVIYNILDDNYTEDRPLSFITMSRATPEKGIHRILEMAKRFKQEDKKFIWFLCCSLDQVKDKKIVTDIKSIPEFIIVPPSVNNKCLISNCDYLVQLSDTESFCYSAFEALQRGVPVILTEFPEAYNIVDDGENGFILKYDLSNLDVDKIFNNKPTNNYYIDRCNKNEWEKLFNEGEL